MHVQSPLEQCHRWRSPAIDDVAVISNGLGELALLDRRGNVVSWNLPDADGVPVAHDLYDAPWKTSLRLGLDDKDFQTSRRLEDMSHTLVSTWANKTGTARERAAMVGSPSSSDHGQMVRLLTCERGIVNAGLDLNLVHGYRGEEPVRWTVERRRPDYLELVAQVGGRKLFLATNMVIELAEDQTSITGGMALEPGQSAWVWLGWSGHASPRNTEEVEHLLKESDEGWARWVQSLNIPDDEYAALVMRCAILLRGLGHRAGSFYAAASRSLPEDDPDEVGMAVRCWDYLFHWLRDGGLTVFTLDDLGDREVLPALVRWYDNLPDLRPSTKIMYGVRGEDVALLGEHIVDELGYRGSVFRYGNGAGSQRQIDSLAYEAKARMRLAKYGTVDLEQAQALGEQAGAARFQPCCGVWEVRPTDGEALVVWASAQILNAQALCSIAKICRIAGMVALARRYEEMAAEVKQWLLDKCVWDGVIMAAPDLRVLDSSILLAILECPDVFDLRNSGDRELVRATVEAIDTSADDPNPVRGLRVGKGHVRYHTDVFNDGISLDREAKFVFVTGQVAQVFLRLGDLERADAIMRELLDGLNDLGMSPEERTVDGRGLGNVNQAYVYQVVINYYLERATFVAALARRTEGQAA
ncbi:glycoside hydrolase family 15 protein [Spirillospora sp. CA-108201]